MATDNVFDLTTGKPSETVGALDRQTTPGLTERTKESIGDVLSLKEENARLKEENARLKEEKRQMHEVSRENAAILKKLNAIIRGFRSNNIDTIQDAVLYIEREMTKVSFAGPSGIRIILTPTHDEKGRLVENPIAQMLADSIEMMQIRFSDKDFVMTESDMLHKKKVEKLTSLLPLSENALRPTSTSSSMKILPADILFAKTKEASHILSQEEVGKLNARIFGETRSALAYPISGVGEILFLSKNPEYYHPDQDTFLIEEAMETIGVLLWQIGKNEKSRNDLLTGLPLRRNFTELSHKLCEDAEEENKEVSFVLIDADHFKNVNDSYGHAAGDLVLKTLGRLLVHKLKPADVKVRWGGEEFGILMQAAPDEATMAIQRVFDDMKKIIFQIDSNGIPSVSHGTVRSDFKTFSITLSAGISGSKDKANTVGKKSNITQIIQPSSTEELDQLIKEADERLYAAKHAGRDRIIFE